MSHPPDLHNGEMESFGSGQWRRAEVVGRAPVATRSPVTATGPAFIHVTEVIRGLRGEVGMPWKPGWAAGLWVICPSTESKVGYEAAGIELQRNQVYLRVSNPGGLGYAHDPLHHFAIQVGRKRNR